MTEITRLEVVSYEFAGSTLVSFAGCLFARARRCARRYDGELLVAETNDHVYLLIRGVAGWSLMIIVSQAGVFHRHLEAQARDEMRREKI